MRRSGILFTPNAAEFNSSFPGGGAVSLWPRVDLEFYEVTLQKGDNCFSDHPPNIAQRPALALALAAQVERTVGFSGG